MTVISPPSQWRTGSDYSLKSTRTVVHDFTRTPSLVPGVNVERLIESIAAELRTGEALLTTRVSITCPFSFTSALTTTDPCMRCTGAMGGYCATACRATRAGLSPSVPCETRSPTCVRAARCRGRRGGHRGRHGRRHGGDGSRLDWPQLIRSRSRLRSLLDVMRLDGRAAGEPVHVDGEVRARRRGPEGVEHRIEVALHLARRLVTIGRILLQRLEHDRVDLRRHLIVQFRGFGDARFAHLLEDRKLVVAAEQLSGGEHLEQHGGQREDVGAAVDVASPGLLGRHVLQLALERARLRMRCLRRGFGDAEVAQLDVPFLGYEDVLWRNVAMHESHLFVFEVV